MITAEQVIEENSVHREDVKKGIQASNKVMEEIGNQHDLDKEVLKNAKILATALNTGDFKKWNEIHLETQRHHIPFILNNISDINLFDLLECCIDGCVANMRRTGEEKTLETEINFFYDRGIATELAVIMANTIIMLQKEIKIDKELEPKEE